MSKEVNLISSRRKESSISYRQAGNIKKVAYIFLGLCVIASVGLFVLNSTSELGTLSKKEDSLNQTLHTQQKKIVKMTLIKDRIESISDIQKKSKSYEDILVNVSSALPQDSKFDSFEVTKNSLNVTVSSSSLLSVNSFLDYIINNINKNHIFQKVTVSSLVGDIQSGKYILVLDVTLL